MSAPVKASAELEAQIRADRTTKPWLFAGATECDDVATALHTERMALIGVPLAVKIGVAIGQARRRDHLTAATAHATAAVASGLIGREAADAIEAAVLEKHKGLAWHRQWWERVAPPRVLNRVTERRPRIEHRAKLAASGPMPPDLAKKFTVGELAVMKIMADEVALRGTCRASKKEISDRARASETTCHNAIRKAVHLGMINVKHRPMKGRKSLPNLIIIIDPDWCLWIARPKYRAIQEDIHHKAQQKQGANQSTPQSVHIYKKDAQGVWRDQQEATRDREAVWRPPPPTEGMAA